MKYFTFIILCIVQGHGFAQYTYFDISHQENGIGESYSDLLVIDQHYVIGGIHYTSDDVVLLRNINLNGEITSDHSLEPSQSGLYLIKPHEIVHASNTNTYFLSSAVVREEIFEGFIIKFDANLDSLWQKFYTVFDQGSTIFQSSMIDGENLILTAYSEDFSTYPWKGGTALINMNAEGEIIWNKPIKPFTEGYMYRDMTIDKLDDGYVIGGLQRYVPEPGVSEFVATVTKTSLVGDVLWEYSEEYDGLAGFARVINHSINGITAFSVQEYEPFTEVPGSDYVWTELNMRVFNEVTGEILNEIVLFDNHEILHGGPGHVIESPDGGYLLCGSGYKFVDINDTKLLAWLIKLDSLGNVEWFQDYVHNNDPEILEEALWDIEIAPDGGCIIAGSLRHYGDQASRSWLLKVDACGEIIWDDCDYVGINESDALNNLINIYPNPASDNITFSTKYTIEINHARIYDVQGDLVLEKHYKGFLPEYTLNVSSLSSGVYYLRIENGFDNEIYGGKVVVE